MIAQISFLVRSSHLMTEVEEKISAYVDENNVQLVYNDSQTLEAAYLMFLLIYSTVKQNCKAGIKLNLSEDDQYLKVMDVCDVHNHEVSKVYKFKHYKLNQSY